jgi:hypothetical protein
MRHALSHEEYAGRDAFVIDELLRELAELRELDRRRNIHAPGSPARDAATLEVDLRSRRLMDRFRDLDERRLGAASRPGAAWTRPLDARDLFADERASHLN